ncbi:hypothetical protein BMW24_011395 [Mycobacterium heckeshornense]|nr:hypothetical protein ACT16_22590 [Mycobacterium heckeshornense]PIJ34606.1 hypothetical protein BMW24_011395 [Mycobacterium heckeshornense]
MAKVTVSVHHRFTIAMFNRLVPDHPTGAGAKGQLGDKRPFRRCGRAQFSRKLGRSTNDGVS